jgi:hypothetical protein
LWIPRYFQLFGGKFGGAKGATGAAAASWGGATGNDQTGGFAGGQDISGLVVKIWTRMDRLF